jgi:hypothetical protein
LNSEMAVEKLSISNGIINPHPSQKGFVSLEPSRGEVVVNDGVNPPWPPFIPLADGRPILKGARFLDARYRAHTLAVKVEHPNAGGRYALYLFRGPGGETLANYRLDVAEYAYALSPHGEHLAVQTGPGSLRIYHVGEGGKPRCSVFQGGYPQQVTLSLYRHLFILGVGATHFHTVHWLHGKLELVHSQKAVAWSAKPNSEARVLFDRTHSFVPSFSATGHLPFIIGQHPERFVCAVELDGLLAVLDRFGQVSILDPNHNLVCMFLARRNQIGVWMPDGSRAGSALLTGGPPTPGALEKIGQALAQASRGGSA